MGFWTTIFLIVLVVFGYAFWHRRTELEEKRMDFNGRRLNDEDRDAARSEIEHLRERIAVLERIATDERGPRRLSDEIEALRELERDEEGVSDDRK